jgi:hypothetical protein
LEAQGLGWDLPLDDVEPFVRVIDGLASAGEQALLDRRRIVKQQMRRLLADPSLIEASRRVYDEAMAGTRHRWNHRLATNLPRDDQNTMPYEPY